MSFDTVQLAKGISQIASSSKKQATLVAAPTKVISTQKRSMVEGDPPSSNKMADSSQASPQADSDPPKVQSCGFVRSKNIMALEEEQVSQEDVSETVDTSGGISGSSSFLSEKNVGGEEDDCCEGLMSDAVKAVDVDSEGEIGPEQTISQVPCSKSFNSDLQLVISGGEGFVSG